MTSLPPLPFTQPFSVGDRIYDTYSHWPIEATVTELTSRGFKYDLDQPQPFGRAAWGQMQIGGEVYLDMPESAYHLKQWAKAEARPPEPPREWKTEYMAELWQSEAAQHVVVTNLGHLKAIPPNRLS